jgi:hypothetical protein
MKIAINRCYGGFSISDEAVWHYAKLKGINLVARQRDGDMSRFFGSTFYIDGIEDDDHYFSTHFSSWDGQARTDPYLIQTIEELGEAANGACAEIMIVDVPDDVEWYIGEYDGMETVHEEHRMWP